MERFQSATDVPEKPLQLPWSKRRRNAGRNPEAGRGRALCNPHRLVAERKNADNQLMSTNAADAGGWRRLWWSLAGRIWLTSLALVILMGALGVSIAARLAILERSVNRVLSRNYR